jgi:hypothetical protein
MSLRIEGIGAAGAAVSTAVGAILDWPILFGIGAVLAVAATASYFSKGRHVADNRTTAAASQSQIKTGVVERAAVISR